MHKPIPEKKKPEAKAEKEEVPAEVKAGKEIEDKKPKRK